MLQRQPVVEVIDEAMAEILRKKTPVERLNIAFGMWESAQVMIRGAVRQQNPQWSDKRVDREVARRLSHGEVDYGDE